ncbi:putative ribonuclease H-like domain-containing protein [Tanacetum coccineum]
MAKKLLDLIRQMLNVTTTTGEVTLIENASAPRNQGKEVEIIPESYQAEKGPIYFTLMTHSSSGSSSSSSSDTELEEALKEKDDLKLKLENFEESSKNLTKLINSQLSAKDKTCRESDVDDNPVNDRFKTGEGLHAVPPPYTGNYMPPRPDLSFVGLDDSVFKSAMSETVTSVPETETSISKTIMDIVEMPKTVRPMLLIIGECGKGYWKREIKPVWNNAQRVNHQNKLTHPHPKRNFVPTAVATKSGQVPINAAKQNSPRAAASISTDRPVNDVAPKPKVNDALPITYSYFKAHSPVRRPFNQKSASKSNNFKEKVNTVRFNNITTVGPKAVVSTAEGNKDNDVKSSACWIWRPKGNVIDHFSKDSGSYTPKRFDYVDPQVDAPDNTGTVLTSQIIMKLMVDCCHLERKGKAAQSLICDNGTEFENTKMNQFCQMKGIKREFGVARTPQQNGVAERKNRTQIKAARTMLADSLLPTTFWAEAINTASYMWMPEADLNHLETNHDVIPVAYKTRIYKDHPKDQIIGDLNLATQTRRMINFSEEHGMEPKKGDLTLTDPRWIYKQCQEELSADLKLQKRKGYTQEEGIDYDKVFAPVARIEAIRLFLAFTSFMGFIVYQMDVKSAFLYGTIEEEVYVRQPPGFEDPQFPNNIYKSIKNKTLFIKKDRGDILLVQVYADDIVFGSTKKSLCTEFESLMHKKFQMSSIRELTFFLRYRSCREMMESSSVKTKFQVTPKVSHLHAVKRIFRYLKGQPKLGLWYPRDSPFDLEAFSDSDYAGASLDRKSTTGGCQFLGKRLISWQCKKQTIVANSTTEAEYVAAANCCGQVLWIQNQMLDYGFNFMNTKIYIDNESTICIVKNPVFHSKTKHIEIRHHFIRDSYEKRLIQVIKIHTDHNVADLLTKAFDAKHIEYMKCVKSQTPRQTKRGRDTKIPQFGDPPEKVGDEAVHKELGDRIIGVDTARHKLNTARIKLVLPGIS